MMEFNGNARLVRDHGNHREPTWKQSGVDGGRITLHDGAIGMDSTIVLKEHGSRYWSGIGLPQGYAPAQFIVAKVVGVGDINSVDAMPNSFKVEIIHCFPCRKESR